MTEFQITRWRDLPSLVVARDAEAVTKTPLPQRFQEAIDEAAMRLGAIDADAYLAGWVREPWQPADGDTAAVCERIAAQLEGEWPSERVSAYLDAIGPAVTD